MHLQTHTKRNLKYLHLLTCQSKSYGQNINVAPGTKKHQVSGSWGKQKKITRPAVRKIWPGIPTPGKSLNLEDCSFVL